MSILNYTLEPATWTDINTEVALAIGANMVISNLGKVDIRIIQSVTEPVAVVGDIITPNNKAYARATVTGGDTVWLYADYECEVAVQEIV